MIENNVIRHIESLIETEYSQLKPSNKINVRSNGIREWTVLASIVAIDRENNKIRIITMGTGVKSTPDVDLHRSGGKILHDCHAEILAIRGFNTVLLEHMKRISNREYSDLLISSNTKGKYRWNPKWRLAMYISRLPCGDASMDSMDIITSEDKILDMIDDDPYQYIDTDVQSILRGRFNYNKKGYVRTKPGRMDSKITLSKSCSDKLAIRQVTSLLNCMTWSLMDEPIYLEYLLIPNIVKKEQTALNRCFNMRLKKSIYPIHHLQFISCEEKFTGDKQSEGDKPSSLSSIKLFFDEYDTLEQAILNGVKNGFYTNSKKPLRKNCESKVSRYSQWLSYIYLNPSHKFHSYLSFKATQIDRKEMINQTRKILAGENWLGTFTDDVIM